MKRIILLLLSWIPVLCTAQDFPALELIGDFSGWSYGVACDCTADGTYTVTMQASPGWHAVKFRTPGLWGEWEVGSPTGSPVSLLMLDCREYGGPGNIQVFIPSGANAISITMRLTKETEYEYSGSLTYSVSCVDESVATQGLVDFAFAYYDATLAAQNTIDELNAQLDYLRSNPLVIHDEVVPQELLDAIAEINNMVATGIVPTYFRDDGKYYNLQGVEVEATDLPRVYIHNGKVFMK